MNYHILLKQVLVPIFYLTLIYLVLFKNIDTYNLFLFHKMNFKTFKNKQLGFIVLILVNKLF